MVIWIHRRVQDCWNRNVFSLLLNCSYRLLQRFSNFGRKRVPRMGSRDSKSPVARSSMSESRNNEITTRDRASILYRLCRPEDELTGWQSSVRYSGAAPTIQCRTRRAILIWMRFWIGSQWSSLRMAAETHGASFRTRIDKQRAGTKWRMLRPIYEWFLLFTIFRRPKASAHRSRLPHVCWASDIAQRRREYKMSFHQF